MREGAEERFGFGGAEGKEEECLETRDETKEPNEGKRDKVGVFNYKGNAINSRSTLQPPTGLHNASLSSNSDLNLSCN